MKKILAFLLILSFYSCASYKGYYSMKLVDVESPKNGLISNERTIHGIDFGVYKDDIMDVSLIFHPSYVDVNLKNNTDATISVVWDETVFSGLDGTSDAVVHSGTFFRDKNLSQVPSSVVRGTNLKEIIVPKSKIVLYRDGVAVRNFLPRSERWIGNKINIALPIISKNEKIEYIFIFESSFENVRGVRYKKYAKSGGLGYWSVVR